MCRLCFFVKLFCFKKLHHCIWNDSILFWNLWYVRTNRILLLFHEFSFPSEVSEGVYDRPLGPTPTTDAFDILILWYRTLCIWNDCTIFRFIYPICIGLCCVCYWSFVFYCLNTYLPRKILWLIISNIWKMLNLVLLPILWYSWLRKCIVTLSVIVQMISNWIFGGRVREYSLLLWFVSQLI